MLNLASIIQIYALTHILETLHLPQKMKFSSLTNQY